MSEPEPRRRKRARTRRTAVVAGIASLASFLAGVIATPVTAYFFPGIRTWVQESIGVSSFRVEEDAWPFAACADAAAASMEGPLLSEIASSMTSPTPEQLIADQHAIAWNRASLTLELSANHADDDVTISDVRPVIYNYSAAPALWAVEQLGGGCGGAYQRAFDLNLKAGDSTLLDLGVLEGPGERPPEVRMQQLGTAFVVTQEEPALVSFFAEPTDGYYEFGLEIDYRINGVDRTRTVGDRLNPFRVAGGDVEQLYMVDASGQLSLARIPGIDDAVWSPELADDDEVMLDHPRFGRTLLTARAERGEASPYAGALRLVDETGAEVWTYETEVMGGYNFFATVMDASGNIFVHHNPGRHNGVVVLRPSDDGFEDFESLPDDPTAYAGRFYDAGILDVDGDGVFEIVQHDNDCEPDCARGTVGQLVFRWSGKDYVRDLTG